MAVGEKLQNKSPARRERLEARVTAEQKHRLTQAAQLSGRSLTDFVVAAADDRAREIIRAHEVMTLSPGDSRAFVEALLSDAEPGDRLKTAARKYRQRSGR